LLRCRETDVRTIPGLKTELVWNDGARLPGRLFEETLAPLPGGEVVARFADGRPAAVSAASGKGRTLALGSYLGVAYEQDRSPALQKFFTGLLDWAGVSRRLIVEGDEAEARVLESGAARLLFVFSHAPNAQTVSAGLAGTSPVSAVDIVAQAAVTPVYRGGRTWFAATMHHDDVPVLLLTPAGAPAQSGEK
jgi:hypothetical protein